VTDAPTRHLRCLRVVIVSPGDVQRERAASERVVTELNRSVAADRACHLSLWRWETDAWPRLHLDGPQGAIDEQMKLEEADLVVGIFWRRFGTPTHEEGSGTEHELRLAWAAWRAHERPEVMVYFCQRAYRPTNREETDQWGRVLDFHQELPREQLTWTYRTVPQFERLLREHLTRFLLDRVAPRSFAPTATTANLRLRFNLPPVAASFTGREDELEAIDEALGVADRALVTQAIAGLGGVGKSQLAARYVQTRADAYDVVAWIRAEDGGTADLAALAGRLGVEVDGLAPAERAQLALDQLANCDQPWLLVLDNVASARQLAPLLPRGSGGRVLVTSRDRSLRQFGPLLELHVFDEHTATDYLMQRAGRPRDADDARKLARALGRLPLALSHAAAFCQDGTSFAAYAALLDDLPADKLFTEGPDEFYERTVAATWRVSIEAATARAPMALDVLEMAAHLGPDAIPKGLFDELADTDSAAARKSLTDALNALARFSLAAVDDETVGVHRLLQKVVRDDVSSRGERHPMRRGLAAVSAAFPADEELDLPENWPACERLRAHALALAAVLPAEDEQARLLVALLNRVSRYLVRVGARSRATDVAATARDYAMDALPRDDPTRLNADEHLAVAYHEAGQSVKAIAIYEPLLADRQRSIGAEHGNTLRTRNNLANAYRAAGRVDDAIALRESLVADSERILGPEHPGTLSTRNNLANAYHEAGRTDDAIALHRGLLHDRERMLGTDHPDTLSTRNNLAIACRAAGRPNDAIAILEPLLIDRERILGPDHPDTLSTRHNLANAYQTAARTADAITLYEPLLTDRERVLGPDHPDTLSTRHNLANAYQAAARTADAQRLQQSAPAEP